MKTEEEIIDILQEECAELIQILSKIKRFGKDFYHPKELKTNLECLIQEIGDVYTLIDCIVVFYGISTEDINKAIDIKMEKLKTWTKEISKML